MADLEKSGNNASGMGKSAKVEGGKKVRKLVNEKSKVSSSDSIVKTDSEKEVNSLKRKKEPSMCQSTEAEPTYASVLKHSDKENAQAIPTGITNGASSSNKRMKMDPLNSGGKLVASKPPIPPKPDAAKLLAAAGTNQLSKSKKSVVTEAQNAVTVQKLLAQNEQMRLEIGELRANLATERNAVRVLRAQNESDLRRSKTECKKLQEALTHQKRNVVSTPSAKKPNRGDESSGSGNGLDSGSGHGSQAAQSNHPQSSHLDVLKLNQELSALRESNRFLEEKIQISSDAERRKAADIRVQRDLYELRLTQLTKSAKSEIQRLLEELKSKDRNIDQLRKDIVALHSGSAAATRQQLAGKREKKAAKNSAQQSQEVRTVPQK
ncbi:janus kinase and microtubule-interacting protein 3-like isoform X2 [Uranotaenia lowii]|uniref:janus kinase and microtubule-interacting protein 3-like isoform X2 n=1 Tax=Uranotaenia lowii TaxID=190385 RepID=UPI0024796F00|nr:janus kinase and microtubule-interacting protein 3-like isoform X2 [Uranotaenia lowii]